MIDKDVFNPASLEAIAAAFALQVPSVALLVLPSDAPVHRAVFELRCLGINARALDVVQDEHGKAHLMRRDVDGPVTERFEPAQRIHFDIPGGSAGSERAWLREGLYTHLQTEKYASWWALPERALAPGEVLYVDKEHGAHVWDADANLVWESPRVIAA